VLIVERGQFYLTPEQPGMPPPQNPPQKLPFLAWLMKGQPFEYWARPDHGRGVLDLLQKMRTEWNPNGLYQYSMFRQADILTASGVGGGSLIYSNVNFKPNEKVLQVLKPAKAVSNFSPRRTASSPALTNAASIATSRLPSGTGLREPAAASGAPRVSCLQRH
jgi:hypothetical protein